MKDRKRGEKFAGQKTPLRHITIFARCRIAVRQREVIAVSLISLKVFENDRLVLGLNEQPVCAALHIGANGVGRCSVAAGSVEPECGEPDVEGITGRGDDMHDGSGR